MLRILVLGAHPDDAEFFAGGFLGMHAARGTKIKIVSVTNGQSGHHRIPTDDLIRIRRQEAAAAGNVIHSEYQTWDFPDGALQPTLDVRHAIIREIRRVQPHLVLTHRPCDYHPDHRAVGQAVQDASYMVRVPKITTDVPPPDVEPIVGYMNDLFTRPYPFHADAVLDVSAYRSVALEMMDCHRSQFYEWLPWIEGCADSLPTRTTQSDQQWNAERKNWLNEWFNTRSVPRAERFWPRSHAPLPSLVEAFEISEYAGRPTSGLMEQLFPNAVNG